MNKLIGKLTKLDFASVNKQYFACCENVEIQSSCHPLHWKNWPWSCAKHCLRCRRAVKNLWEWYNWNGKMKIFKSYLTSCRFDCKQRLKSEIKSEMWALISKASLQCKWASSVAISMCVVQFLVLELSFVIFINLPCASHIWLALKLARPLISLATNICTHSSD